jgi:hypothetical protein
VIKTKDSWTAGIKKEPPKDYSLAKPWYGNLLDDKKSPMKVNAD